LASGQADASHLTAVAGEKLAKFGELADRTKMLKSLGIQLPNINEREQVPQEAILAVVDYLAETFDPEKIILFGSYAYGEPKPWSDVDLLVVAETESSSQLQRAIAFSFEQPFGIDILVRTPQEIAERIPQGDFFLWEIMSKGKILYEKDGTPLRWSEPKMKEIDHEPNDLVSEWIQKAEGDYVTSIDLFTLGHEITADSICFHCQQCVEKYLKAYLTFHLIEFPRTHDLLELMALAEQQGQTFGTVAFELRGLNNYSVDIRYPGKFTSFEEAKGALEAVKKVRAFIRSQLGL
jgi:HEPN domain-containing protein/predicted nucleotidyltransferase